MQTIRVTIKGPPGLARSWVCRLVKASLGQFFKLQVLGNSGTNDGDKSVSMPEFIKNTVALTVLVEDEK